jgi:hypothetical protein
MGRKSNHLMERVYAHLSKNGCRKSGLLADPDLNDTLVFFFNYCCSTNPIWSVEPPVYSIGAAMTSYLKALNAIHHHGLPRTFVIDKDFISLTQRNLFQIFMFTWWNFRVL